MRCTLCEFDVPRHFFRNIFRELLSCRYSIESNIRIFDWDGPSLVSAAEWSRVRLVVFIVTGLLTATFCHVITSNSSRCQTLEHLSVFGSRSPQHVLYLASSLRSFHQWCSIGVARGGPDGPRPQRMRKKYVKTSLVNLTLNMRYTNDKKDHIILSSPDSFFQAQNAPKSVFGPLGELTTLIRPPSRLGRGITPPHSPPLSTPSASRTRRLYGALVLRPPQHKILATPLWCSK